MPTTWISVPHENLVKVKESGIYYLQASVAGKKVRKSLRTNKLRIAKLKRDDLLAALRTQSGKPSSSPIGDYGELVESVVSYYKSLPSYQIKPKSLVYRMECLSVLDRTIGKDLGAWDGQFMRQWWSSPGMVKFSAGRRNNVLGTLRKMIELLIESGAVDSDPTRLLKRVKIVVPRVVVPSQDSFKKIVAQMRIKKDGRTMRESADMVEFMAYSGCRLGEAREVLWRDINADEILVTGGVYGTKNHEARRVPIVSAMRDLLSAMERGEDDAKVFNILNPKKALSTACVRLRVDHMTPKTCRHYFATVCIESGVDVPTVAKWMGHKDGGALAMKVYGHLRDDHSRAAAKRVRF
ncbi:MAG: tyrosine-type recombinase/integrase [Akkermansiaceae bacterium]